MIRSEKLDGEIELARGEIVANNIHGVTEQIVRVEAADNYVWLHLRDDRFLLRETMAALEARLGSVDFVRVNRYIGSALQIATRGPAGRAAPIPPRS